MKNTPQRMQEISLGNFLRSTLSALMVLIPVLAMAQVPWLHVEGNQIKDENGNEVTLRGVSVLAPEHNNECEYCEAKPISEMISWQADAARGWNSRIVRLQITRAKTRDPEASFNTIIDPYVQQAIAMGLYVIVDLHHVSNFDYNGSGGTTRQSVLDFWNYVAPRYANTPNVIFEVYNEPIAPDCWSCWKEFIQPVVDAIRQVAPDNLILMGGPQWSTRVNQAASDPFSDANMAYVYHIYPNQGAASTSNLDSKFGTAAQSIPVMLTEFGWNQDSNYSDGVTNGTTSGWGASFRDYLDARPHLSWTSYIFDNFWKPQYFDWEWNLMDGENQGQFMQQWFLEMKDENQPEADALTAHGVTPRQVNLTWPSDSQAFSYNVKRSSQSGGPYTTVAPGLTGRTYSDTTLSAETTYYYVVSSNTTSGEGTNSTEAAATTTSPGHAPDVPMYLKATGGNGQVTLNWRGAPGAEGYLVKRSTNSNGPYSIIGAVSDTTAYADTTVTNGVVYYYVVAAESGGKESANSVQVSDIPSSEVIFVDNTSATQTGAWTASSGSPGYYGANYLHDGNTGAAGGKSVTYSPAIVTEGSYHVSMWWTAASNRASNVTIEVHHTGGTAIFTINQQYNGGLWLPLGIFRLGANSKVVIRNDGTDGYVIADAIKFARSSGNINILPNATFDYEVDGLNVDFDASGSWDGDGSIIAYSWDFGDSTTATGVSPSHVYGATGDYLVTLTVTDDSSATHSSQHLVTVTQPVNKLPAASFSYTTNLLEAVFDGSASTDSDGSIVGYAWDFGDSSSATGVTASHTYAASGSYLVTLTVVDDSSATATYQQMVSVSNDLTETTTLVVNQQQNGGVMNVLGTFSFAAGSSGAVRIRTEGTNGYVVADAVRFSMSGQSDIIVDNDDVNAETEGSWMSNNYASGYIGSDYLHDNNSGKGTKTITYTPNLPVSGIWTVSMQWTAHTNRATNVPVEVIHLKDTSSNQPPVPAFSYTATGLTVDFDASASTDHGSITGYAWYFGDGHTGSGEMVSHTYASEGNYQVTLTVTDDSSATASVQQALFLLDGDGLSTVVVNQQQHGGLMNVLGTFPFAAGTGGSVKIRTNDTNGYVVADAVRFSMSGQPDIVLDNSDSNGVSFEGTWPTSAVNSGYQGLNYAHDDNTGKGSKSVTYTPDFPVAGNWTVSVQWTSYTNRATNVPIDIIYTPENTNSAGNMWVAEIIEGEIDSGSWGLQHYGTVTVKILDEQGNPVSHANVTGTFSGDFDETVSGITGADGKLTLMTSRPKGIPEDLMEEKPKGLRAVLVFLRKLAASLKAIQELRFGFCIDDISHESMTYQVTAGSVTCSDAQTDGRILETEALAPVPEAILGDWIIYPNPVTDGKVTLRYTGQTGRPMWVRVVSLSGEELFRQEMNASETVIDLTLLGTGMYLIITEGDGVRMHTTKLIVK